jgi:hypothetical protein
MTSPASASAAAAVAVVKIPSGSAVAADIAAALHRPTDVSYVNLAQVVVLVCEHMSRFPTMSGLDKKEMAMSIARKVYAAVGQSSLLNETLLSDLIDVAITLSHTAGLAQLAADAMAAAEAASSGCGGGRGCFGGVFAAESPDTKVAVARTINAERAVAHREAQARSVDEAQRDLTSHMKLSMNVALLVQQACAFLKTHDDMTGSEKRAKAIEMIKLALASAGQSAIVTDRVIGDVIDMVVAVGRGLLLVQKTATDMKNSCCGD